MNRYHQTQLDISPFNTDDGGLDEEPTVIPPTPAKGRGKASGSVSRNLLFRFREESVDLANQLPRWMTPSRTPTPTPTPTGRSTTTPGTSSGDKDLFREILKEVRSSNERVGERLEQLEKQMKDLQDDQSDERTLTKRKKICPSPQVREMVRKVYKALYEEDENFGWDIGKCFSHSKNVEVLQRLSREVKGQLPETSSVTIKAAAKTYFCSVSGTERLKSSGKYSSKCTRQKRRNRIIRKLKRRKVALAKTTSLSEERKTIWAACLTADFMSSEDSFDEGEEDEEDMQFVIRPLLWRSDKVNSFLSSLDHKTAKCQSKRSRNMSFKRIVGLPSDRLKPSNVPDWTIKP